MATIKTVRMPGLVEVSDPGNAGAITIPDHHNMVCILTSAGVETRNFGDPQVRRSGLCDVSSSDVAGGNIVVNVSRRWQRRYR